ncbi:ABC transporter ATP-binding protein [Clostridium ihumii]|uniref:ABC transporter ATP-binding protein n=1 Tax=Clostridium ihumii TaxID=1470356 RepID=UPI00058E3948|nr:ABC transporter ATP-binding protein [Clostridium ihumii]
MEGKKKSYIKFFYKYLKEQKIMLIAMFIMSLINIFMQIINPQISRYFIDEATNGNVGKNLIYAASMFLVIAFFTQVFSVLTVYIGEKEAWKITNNIRLDLIEHCINLDMCFHKEHTPGELLERVDGDISQMFDLFSRIILNMINNLILLVGILIILFKENMFVGVSITVFSIFSILILWKTKSKTEKYWIDESKANAEFYGRLGEYISNTEDIAANGAKKYIMGKFYDITRKIYPVTRKAKLTWATLWSVILIIFATSTIISFSVSLHLWKKGIITVGTAYLIFNYTEILRRPLEQIRVNLQELQLSGASIIRVFDLFQVKSNIKYGKEFLNQKDSLEIQLKNVDFQYEESIDVLKDISIKLEGGKVLGILGHTGSGKTTLARIIVRMYDVKKGVILLNKKDIKSLNEQVFTDNIAYITQDVEILKGTIRENITMFKNYIDDKQILDSIYSLGFGKWYESLKNGLETNLEMGSKSISVGEAQLIAFTRVFIKKPKLIILDEATSRIDVETEKLIENALNKILRDRTCIIIAHRLSTLNKADKIMILEKGCVIEFGERKNLLEDKNSTYYNLIEGGIDEVLV